MTSVVFQKGYHSLTTPILLHVPFKMVCVLCLYVVVVFLMNAGIKQKNLVDAHYWDNNDQF